MRSRKSILGAVLALVTQVLLARWMGAQQTGFHRRLHHHRRYSTRNGLGRLHRRRHPLHHPAQTFGRSFLART